MSSLNEKKIVSAILGQALQIPGLATVGPRLVCTKDSNHEASEMQITTNNGTDYLEVKYRGRNLLFPMSFVACVEYK